MTVALVALALALPATVCVLGRVLLTVLRDAAQERRELTERIQNPDLVRAEQISRLAPPAGPEADASADYVPVAWDDDLALAD